ncbi:hypothetical protein ABZ192_23900 [Streptomyces sp. NPDC006235]|uniref:hypothetical protein n=1 Tax=Streptomyces sp. NPDC006235 TaxID=3156736 RepID=UPI0033A6E874
MKEPVAGFFQRRPHPSGRTGQRQRFERALNANAVIALNEEKADAVRRAQAACQVDDRWGAT